MPVTFEVLRHFGQRWFAFVKCEKNDGVRNKNKECLINEFNSLNTGLRKLCTSTRRTARPDKITSLSLFRLIG